METSRNNNVIPPPARIKSVTRYRAGPIISALTWCVGIRNELDVEIATVIAKIAGSPPAANAIETASGTKSTVAPTFDITKVKTVARSAISGLFADKAEIIPGLINKLTVLIMPFLPQLLVKWAFAYYQKRISSQQDEREWLNPWSHWILKTVMYINIGALHSKIQQLAVELWSYLSPFHGQGHWYNY